MAIKTENEHGSIILTNTAIAHIAGAVATGCYGVVGMAYKSTGENLASLLKWDTITKGIKVTTEDDGICINLPIIVAYGINIQLISDSIISNVRFNVENMTGLRVSRITVNVEGIRVN
ncbi:MAG: Asp23/Gls24 family envelope stress response protein [Ruminococcaceae bacterium]|nr:Asp23/Gls24 family envelope stress response protein [Oscillospiraceae bacterium]